MSEKKDGSTAVKPETADYDSPWKEVLGAYFRQFMEFFFPAAAADIDWSQPVDFLDTELQQVVRDAEMGRRYADKLAQVYRRGGAEALVFAHVEVQGYQEGQFPKRLYSYNYRIFDRFDKPVATLVVLTDDNDGWRPDSFGLELWSWVVSSIRGIQGGGQVDGRGTWTWTWTWTSARRRPGSKAKSFRADGRRATL